MKNTMLLTDLSACAPAVNVERRASVDFSRYCPGRLGSELGKNAKDILDKFPITELKKN